MARPHENETLKTICANPDCGKAVPTEYPYSQGFLVGERREQQTISVCQECVEKGWRPPGYRGRL